MAPTDEELLELMPQGFRDDLALVSQMAAHGAGPDVQPGLFRVTLNTGALDYARAVWDRARAALAQLEPEVVDDDGPDVDAILSLAAIIREVDGNHSLGAAALAEAILSHPGSRRGRSAPTPAGEVAELISELSEENKRLQRLNDTLAECLDEQLRAAAMLEQRHQPAPAPAEAVGELVARLRDRQTVPLLEERDRAAALLERQAAPVPVAVSERLPQPEDCDAEGRCWWFLPTQQLEILRQSDAWSFRRHTPRKDDYCRWTHWLPAHALPLPSGEEE